jgi:phosphonate transport system substrate-binding protein
MLTQKLGRLVEVSVAPSYEALAKDLLSGRTDAAWAPPFVCARVEAMGVRVLVRGVRKGASTYRAALICRADSPLKSGNFKGANALWVDRDSVGGYLLAIGYLRAKGHNPTQLLANQDFAGSYRAAVEGVLEGRADVTSIFAPPAVPGKPETTGVDEVAPGRGKDCHVIAFTDEAPNDGVAVSMNLSAELNAGLERTLLSLHESPDGQALLRDIFSAEQFELAPRLGYRALYRVALASL